jgi:hypothetical protein
MANKPIDVVVDIDGILVLHSGPWSREQGRDRVKETQASDRKKLMSANPKNRWIVASDIRSARLSNRLRGKLTIETTDNERLDIILASSKQVKIVRLAFDRMLGDRFRT